MDEEIYGTIEDKWWPEFDKEEYLTGSYCLRCKTSDGPYFLTEEPDLEEHGFTIQEAELGICVGCAINPSSIGGEINHLTKDDLINKKEGNFIEDENGKTKASILIPVSEVPEEDNEELMIGESTGFCSSHEARYRLKSLYRSAIGDQRYRNMNPPYFVGNRLILYGLENQNPYSTRIPDNVSKVHDNASSKLSEDHPDKATYIVPKNDWFDCLLRSLVEHETQPGRATQRCAYALIATYLHKTHQLDNVEPIWVYMNRMNIGFPQIKRKMDDWITPIPDFHKTQVESFDKKLGINSVLNLIETISFQNRYLDLSEEEKNELKKQSKEIYQLLSSKKITVENRKISIIELLNERSTFRDTFSINESKFHAVGLVEALCVGYISEKVLGRSKSNVMKNQLLFPIENGEPWWKKELSKEALDVFQKFPRWVDFAMK